MSSTPDHAQLASDAELITRVRAGDRAAFGDLYSRHAGAAAALARQFARSAAEADDLVSEAFARVLDGMLGSKGPDTAFRAYLFTTLRNTAYDRTRKDKRLQFTGDMESHDVAVEGDDPVIADLENGLVGRAFAGLPERWQTVLWHTQVEGQSAAEVGILLGMAPNAVSSLAFRAREGLREAYLQAHLAETAAETCRTTVDRLGAWTRGSLSKREKAQVDAHLEECDRCPALAAELSEINGGLRALLAPLLLGGAAAGYIANLGPVVPLVQLGTLSGGSTAVIGGKAAVFGGKASLIGGKAAGTLIKFGSWGPGAALAGVAAAATVLVAGVVIALNSGHAAPPAADRGGSVAGALNPGASTGSGTGNGSNGNGSGANGGGTDVTATGVLSSPTTAATTPPPSKPSTDDTDSTGRTSQGAGQPGGTEPGVTGPAATDGGERTSGGIDTGTPVTTGRPASGALPIVPGTTSQLPTAPSTVPGTGPAGGTSNSATSRDTTSTDTTPATTPETSTPPTSATDTSSSPTTTPTEPTTPTPTPTNPVPSPAVLTVSDPQVSDVVAGGNVTVSLTVSNSGGSASDGSSAVGIQVPGGLTFVGAGTAARPPALRSAGSAFASSFTSAFSGFTAFAPGDAPDTSCSPSSPTSPSNCQVSVPTVPADSSVTVVMTLSVDPDAVDDPGSIVVTFDGQPVDSGTIPVRVAAGYQSASLSSTYDLASASVDRVTLRARAKSGVVDPGTITFSSPQMSVIGTETASGSCTVTSGRVTCPYSAVSGVDGVQLVVAVAADTTPSDVVLVTTGQQNRAVGATGDFSQASTGIGGYGSVQLDGPGTPLRAGSTTTATLTGTVLNAGVVNPGPIVIPVALSDGLSVITDQLPVGCAVSDDDATVGCTPTDRAAGDTATIDFALPIQVSAAATGDQSLADADLPAGPTSLDDDADPLSVDPDQSGYDSISLGAHQSLAAGTMAQLTLTSQVGDGVTDPGPITVPSQLSDGLLITSAQGCAASGDDFVCPAGQAQDPVLTVAVLPTATTADAAPEPAELAGSRSLDIGGTLGVTARRPGDQINLVGPFAGSMIAAQTLYCPTGNSRGACSSEYTPTGKLTPVNVTRTLTTGTDDVVSAEITWAAGSPADSRDTSGSSLNTVTVSVDGVRATVTGSRPTGIGSDTPDKMFARAADLMDYPALAAVLRTAGAHRVLVQNLSARTTATSQLSAMAAWSLSTIWVTDDDADVRIQTRNSGQYVRAVDGSAGRATVAPAGPAVQDLFFTVWAPDATASKSLTFAGASTLPLTVTGVQPDRSGHPTAVGYQVLDTDVSALPPQARSGAAVLSNRPDAGGGDDLWIGPTLVIRTPD